MSQPIYVVKVGDVGDALVRTQRKFPMPASAYWGYKTHEQVYLSLRLAKQPRDGFMDLSSVAARLQELHTAKMIGGGNKALVFLFNQIKATRQTL